MDHETLQQMSHLVVAAHVGGAEPRDATLGHDQRRARLRACRDLQIHAAFDRLHLTTPRSTIRNRSARRQCELLSSACLRA